MKKQKLSDLCSYLYGLVESRTAFPEEIVSEFIHSVARMSRKSSKTKDYDFYELADKCRKYKDYYITHEELFAFQAGRVLGTAEMYDAVWREKELEKQDRKELPKDSVQYQVLKLICGEPGLSAEELSARLPGGKEVPALSRMLRRLEDGDYIMSIRRGCHKQYYATPRGERQMPEFPEKEIRQAKEQQAVAMMPFISELKISKQKDIWMLEEASNVVNEISPNSAKIIKLESAAERQMESRALYRNTVEPERMYYEM